MTKDVNKPSQIDGKYYANDTSLSLHNTTNGSSECGICSGEVGPDDQAITCDNCNKWVHINCGKVTQRLYQRINDAPTNNPVEWVCTTCTKEKHKSTKTKSGTPRPPNFNKLTINSDDCPQLVKLQKMLSDITAQNESLQKTVERLQSDLERTNIMLIHSKQENMAVNQELINQTQYYQIKSRT